MNFVLKWIEYCRVLVKRVLDGMIMFLLGGMVLLAAAQIVMRNVFSFSLFWGDDVLQLALLWLVMTGASAAALSGEHLRIDILVRFVPKGGRPWLYATLHGFTAGICGVLAWQSVRLVQDSITYGDTLLGNVPAWTAQIILPVGFGFLALHYGLRVLSEGFHGLWRRPSHGGTS